MLRPGVQTVHQSARAGLSLAKMLHDRATISHYAARTSSAARLTLPLSQRRTRRADQSTQIGAAASHYRVAPTPAPCNCISFLTDLTPLTLRAICMARLISS